MQVAIFTCARDWGCASLAARTVPASWAVHFVVESRDAHLVAPPSVQILVRDFPRGRNLWGIEAIAGVADTLADLAGNNGRVVKMDSDCLLVDPFCLAEGDVAGMAHRESPRAVVGLAYGLSAKAAQEGREGVRTAIAKGCRPYSECATITSLANRWEDSRLPMGSYWDATFDGTAPPPGTKAIHFGMAKHYKTRDRILPEMQRLGDLLGIWRR